MKVKIDESLCTGCGICETICPDVFEINEEGISQVIADDPCSYECCSEAAENCPEEAIIIEDD